MSFKQNYVYLRVLGQVAVARDRMKGNVLKKNIIRAGDTQVSSGRLVDLEANKAGCGGSDSEDTGCLLITSIPPVLSATNKGTNVLSVPVDVITLDKEVGALTIEFGVVGRKVDSTVELNIDVLQTADADQRFHIVGLTFGKDNGTTVLTSVEGSSNSSSIIFGVFGDSTGSGCLGERGSKSKECKRRGNRRKVDHGVLVEWLLLLKKKLNGLCPALLYVNLTNASVLCFDHIIVY